MRYKMRTYQGIILLLVIIFNFEVVLSQIVSQVGNRIYSGDASCICGIDTAILEKLESILSTLPAQSCPAPTITLPEISRPYQEETDLSSTRPTYSGRPTSISVSSTQTHHGEYNLENSVASLSGGLSSHQLGSVDSHQEQTHQPHPNSEDAKPSQNKPDKNEDDHSVESTNPRPSGGFAVLPPSSNQQLETQIKPPLETQNKPPPVDENTSIESQRDPIPINSGFLNGLTISPISSHNQALAKLNQSSQNVNEKDMASALESTVPNLVSNIFSNIKNLTIQTEQNPDRPQPTTLTSIDGSSVDVKGDSKDQITADGQKLFDVWLDHQLANLNLTAAMASHIRKSAGILFRRIIMQYVQRVERMGGKVELNIQRATQMALNNTQTLIAFLLKNYVNFAAGIMQILGEQVSRVGKQLDSTGDTIAHMSLNPFDIISNVIESLPNPSDYSNYFRNFGKQLLGDMMSLGNGGSGSNAGSSQQGSGSQSGSQQQGGGLITKTIGAISKLGSWFG